MIWLQQQKGTVLLLLYYVGCYMGTSPVGSQGHFPRLENIGAYKAVSTEPIQSSCGIPERNTYCQPAGTQEGLLICSQQSCTQECPHRSVQPPYTDLLSALKGTCTRMDTGDLRPGSAVGTSRSVAFQNVTGCLATVPSPHLGPHGSFTLTVWLKPEEDAVMTVIEKSADGRLVFLLTVSPEVIQIQYSQQGGPPLSLTVRTLGHITVGQWTHLALQVHWTRISFFLNGLEEDDTPFDTKPLASAIEDLGNSEVHIGQCGDGLKQFIGTMQDLRFYPATLTNREIREVYSGQMPLLHIQPECRCPPSHPRVHPLVERYCISNAAGDSSSDRELRVRPDAHPLHYINDNDIGTGWVSSLFLDLEQLDRGVSITFDLQNGEYQVFYVILQFLSPQPEAVRIQRQTSGSSEWRDWQYLARNCSVFGMEDNGPLEQPDSVNCVQFPSDIPYSHGNVSFGALTPEPNPRPGYNDFYNTPALQEFVKASRVRIHLLGQYYTHQPQFSFHHRYYAVGEIIISGRCDCHGHAEQCDTTLSPYRCSCLPESHTQGDNCERCEPLFNDKPYRSGDQVQAYHCRPCQCYGHALSCHYDPSLDPFPGDHFLGGGGVCDDCQHNTTGRNCESCQSSFFREINAVLWTENACKPCECHEAGTVNSSLDCQTIGGQCKCKRRVSGRQCNQCQHGFYKLQLSHPDGCRACRCNTSGTKRADITCHQDSGQCRCKANVMGLTCDLCKPGYKFLNISNPDGCTPCSCDDNGSLDQSCDPLLGQCKCGERVAGLSCDTCMSGYYGLTSNGSCQPCHCNPDGSIPSSECDPVSGQCHCKPHVEGRRCDICKDGFHSLDRSNSLGCLPCRCDTRGTVNGSIVCHKVSGHCRCKDNVLGPRCSDCAPHYSNMSTTHTTGCQSCMCDPTGTVPGTVCDPVSGQCVCLPSRYGQDCSMCKLGFFLRPWGLSGCDVCDCHPVAALSQACDGKSGQCSCRHPSLAGRSCDQCAEKHYGFNPGIGRCKECNCDPAGGRNGSCDLLSGQCACKLFTSGEKCNTCVEGASHMDATNHLGCSKSPSQQPPPIGRVLNSTAIQLTWAPPDSPNSNQVLYTLLRDSAEIASLHSHYPFSSRNFIDADLSPYTLYSYHLVTSNVHGKTTSTRVAYRTLVGIPQPKDLQLFLVGGAKSRSATFRWAASQNIGGPLENYTLTSKSADAQEERLHYSGRGTEALAEALTPFTHYTFSVQACTSSGCAKSAPIPLVTSETVPQLQPPPRVLKQGSSQLLVEWDPPEQPNGIIIRYEVFMRGPLEEEPAVTISVPERQVFHSSVLLHPQTSSKTTDESVPVLPQSSVTVSDLEPFSTYQFRVLSANMAGSVVSNWSTGRTDEGEPERMPVPLAVPVSSSALKISWQEPGQRDSRGQVTQYRVSILDVATLDQFGLPYYKVLHIASPEEREFTAEGLLSYRVYNFTVSVCTRKGCVSSSPISGHTMPAAPEGLNPPKLKALNMSVMEVSWDAPQEANGPPPLYQVERMDPSLSSPPTSVIHGTRFPGHGYFHFPSDTLPTHTYFTGIKLSFRTREEEGLILCAVSPGVQEEYVALQIHKGRPYFLFDPQASAVAVTPINDNGRRYNDNQWHHMIATRMQAVGTIIVDDQYQGSASATSGSTIIGENTGVFVGGLPQEFPLLRQDTGDAQLVRQGFSGCLRDVHVKKSDSPTEMWEPLDWSRGRDMYNTYQPREGCPAHTVEGAHFLGQGYLELKPLVFTGGDNFEISFEFRTDQLNALLLFAYDTESDDYIMAELQGGTLTWALQWGMQVARVHLWVGLSYCDGSWNRITLLKRGGQAAAAMNELAEQQTAATGGQLRVLSPLYLGGVPSVLSSGAAGSMSLLHGFGGCIRDVRLEQEPIVSLAAMSSHAVRVNLDGCLSAGATVNCRGNDSILVYAGSERRMKDHAVQPFTEYLYRVLALGEGGSAAGPWERGRSKETVPQSMLTPSRVVCVNGYSAEVSWDEPAGVRGVIEKYIVRAYNRDDPSVAPISATFPQTEHMTGVLSGLSPFTNYSVTVAACTQAGCTESTGSRNISTPQEAPGGVVSPSAVVTPKSLSLHWSPPEEPNGVITEYLLYKEGILIYRGTATMYNITDLEVYSSHWLLLTACTSAGCSNSSLVSLSTAQLPPTYMEPPVLTVLDSHSVYVQWAAPAEANGVLQFYTLYLSVPAEEPHVVYNSSELFQNCTLHDLLPGTTYLFQIAACTGGGCTHSTPSSGRTEESTPEHIPAPTVLPLSPHSLYVSWTVPLQPNGEITSYGLLMNGVLVQNSSSLHFRIGNLSSWSLHSFRVQACTARGCALGPVIPTYQTEMRTQEAAPEGTPTLEVRSEGPRSLRVRWQGPERPNGNITYTVLANGIFYKDAAAGPTIDTQALHSSAEPHRWVTVRGLIPFSNYSIWVNACNSVACVTSPAVPIELPPGAPDGVMPPRLAAATPSTLQVVWSAPGRSNAPGPLLYHLRLRRANDDRVQLLLKNQTNTFGYSVGDLQPYTEYQLQLAVSNSYGETESEWVSVLTAQGRPGVVNSPLVSDIQPRSASVSWEPPSQPNGIITHYNIYLNSQLITTVPSNITATQVFPLEPYHEYSFQVEACTEAGCILSSTSRPLHTPPAAPEDVPVPRLFSDTPTSVLLSWEQPRRPNGQMERYVVERRLSGSHQVSTVATLQPNQSLSYLDDSASLNPWTTYEYRVVASTLQGGSNSSDWQQVTTRPARPAGLQPPLVHVLGPNSLQVAWSAPAASNGNIERYEIRLPEPRFIHTNMTSLSRTITDLEPYTNYSISILACSVGGGHVGGCSEGPPTVVSTLSTMPQGLCQLSAMAISDSLVALSWQPPQKPNGPNIRYELLRRKTQQPLALLPPEDLNRWYDVYAGAKLFHEDKGLSRYTTYQYKLLVHNDAGHAEQEPVTITTLAGVPIAASNVSSQVLNHTAILVNWTQPSSQDLQGSVEEYILWINSSRLSRSISLPPGVTSAVVQDLQPNTRYQVSLQVFNGAHSVTGPATECTTADGEPEGILPPEVVTINSTAVRVMWTAPLVPNGQVTEYALYLDGQKHSTGSTAPGYLHLGNLLPFTIYEIQVEVCTVFACVKSNSTKVTTVEDQPADLTSPDTEVTSSRSVKIDWMPPSRPNGVLLGYTLHRRNLLPCNGTTGQESFTQAQCSYTKCSTEESICGSICYLPLLQVCCGTSVYEIDPERICCEDQYLVTHNASYTVCCGGQLLLPVQGHQCCGGYYLQVLPGETCCSGGDETQFSIGPGDSCCGGKPFSSSSGQICCDGSLHDGFGSQCCGGRLVQREAVCCGDSESGEAHLPVSGMTCCGGDYVNTSTMLCCTGPAGRLQAHPMRNGATSVKCCESEVIPLDQECCNGVGYDPLNYVCADRAPARSQAQENCRPSTLCPLSAATEAYCPMCYLKPSLPTCASAPSPNILPSLAQTSLCTSAEEVIYSGPDNIYTFTDTGMTPSSQYEYRLGAWNSFGSGFSLPSRVTTWEDAPHGISPPRWSLLGERDDIIHLDWSPPTRPNGMITRYVVLRNRQERYRGTELSFTDMGGISASQEYEYQLRACTAAGCSESNKVLVVTVQGVPEGVPPPLVRPQGPRALEVSWAVPDTPNGVIREYRLSQRGAGVIFTDSSGVMQHNVTGLEPHTSYSFRVTACTAAGCNASRPSTGHTLQDAPAGVWARPHHVVLNSSAVELYWSEPLEPNGVVSSYRILRDGEHIFSCDGQNHMHTDAGLQHGSRYVYQLEATTDGGSTLSDTYIVETPASSPGRIPSPHNVTVTGFRSIFVAWTSPEIYDSNLPIEYNIILNAGYEHSHTQPAGHNHSVTLAGLEPFTRYQMRVQACQQDGCGVSQSIYIETPEAPPEHLEAPFITAAGPVVIEVYWRPPGKANGIIQGYYLYRRPGGTQEELLVFLWSEGPLQFIDTSDILQPFREYEYRLKAINSQGSTSSPWASARTLEAAPEDMKPPIVIPTGAYSVQLTWRPPDLPNGIITRYRVIYQKHQSDPTLNISSALALTVLGSSHEAHLFGLDPYSSYRLQVVAMNTAGSTTSPWVTTRTMEAAPSGLLGFTVEKRERGRAVLLRWPEPAAPNGVIKMYKIYSEGNLEFSGLSRQFLFRRLEPHTTYILVLEACTQAGCSSTAPQRITTEEAPPSSQAPPVARTVRPDSVELSWSPPGRPNGRISRYEVITASQMDEYHEQERVLLAENSTHVEVTGLRPWTGYRFRVRAWNTAGHADSPWIFVQTKQGLPESLPPPRVKHVADDPYSLLVSWMPPEKPNGVLLSYRIQRNMSKFPFSFDSMVLSYTDEGLSPYTWYNYSIIACTVEGCVSSLATQIRTLEAPPSVVEAPVANSISSDRINVSWAPPAVQNGEITRYILRLGGEEVYVGRRMSTLALGLQPHTSYQMEVVACTNGGCSASIPIDIQTREAPPSGMQAPLLKVTGPESVEVEWVEPESPNGVLKGYELRRDGQLIYAGPHTRYHDFALQPSVEYTYTITTNNSQGSTTSPPARARTNPSAPSGVSPPLVQPSSATDILVMWDPPIRANGDILNYTIFRKDLLESDLHTLFFPSDSSNFHSRSVFLSGLKPYFRYEVRVEACTLLGCASSDWATVQTLEAPPAGQTAPMLQSMTDLDGTETVFMVSWSPPSQPNGKILHFELYRRQTVNTAAATGTSLVYKNDSTSYRDVKLKPYSEYEYQVWAVNSAGRSASVWSRGQTGPAPPEGVGAPTVLQVHATSAIVDISSPAQPNGIVTLYRAIAESKDAHLQLSEGTSSHLTLHGLRPFTLYSVHVEVCTCFRCCSQGPARDFHTQATAPAQQPKPQPVALTSRSILVEWKEPLFPNGIIESFELHIHTSCPQAPQPIPTPCIPGPAETSYFGKGRRFNITGLQPYTSYRLRVICYNNMGSTSSDWATITTLKAAPQYRAPFLVISNLTTIFLDWSNSFAINGQLKDFVLMESGLRVYGGFHTSLLLPRTSDKTFEFQVTCTTDTGSSSTPIIKYNVTTGIDAVGPTPVGKTGIQESRPHIYTELWFIILMAILGLFLLLLLLGLLLYRALKPSRERPPLLPLQKRNSMGIHLPSDPYRKPYCPLNHGPVSPAFTDFTGTLPDSKVQSGGSHISNHSSNNASLPPHGQLGHAYSQNSLHRSISQLVDTHDRKSLLEGNDSGMFVDDEELADTIRGLGGGRKEQTVFTDTHL